MPMRRVMAIHAHPDDECTKGAATMARLAAEGHRTVLVICTDGSAGEVTDVALVEDRSLAAVRASELSAAAAGLGFAAVHHLGYRDSGMSEMASGVFSALPLETVVDELIAVIRAEKPDVIVTYDGEYAAGHPDHERCHDAASAAFRRTCEEPGGPQKLYGARTHSPARLVTMHRWLVESGRASPYGDAVGADERDNTTTRVDVAEHLAVARTALRCHRSQIRGDEPWFFAVPDAEMTNVFPWEDFQLLASTVDPPRHGELEADLLDRLR